MVDLRGIFYVQSLCYVRAEYSYRVRGTSLVFARNTLIFARNILICQRNFCKVCQFWFTQKSTYSLADISPR